MGSDLPPSYSRQHPVCHCGIFPIAQGEREHEEGCPYRPPPRAEAHWIGTPGVPFTKPILGTPPSGRTYAELTDHADPWRDPNVNLITVSATMETVLKALLQRVGGRASFTADELARAEQVDLEKVGNGHTLSLTNRTR